jgi:protein-S-isoprenylcysteine O-methyltransferase Ste14
VRDGVNSWRRRFVFLMKGMTMAAVALTLYIAFGVLALGWRCWMQWRRTGSTGYRGISRRLGLLGLVGGIGFIVAMVGGLAAPLLQLRGVVSPLHILDHRWVNSAGFALALCGLAATLYAQFDMGDSWRVGVDTSETTTLVRTGTFRLIRNPIFAAMLVFVLGETLLAPNPVAIAVFAIFLAAIEVSVRTVEEPYLLGIHGDAYRDYTTSVGRFVPGIGHTR